MKTIMYYLLLLIIIAGCNNNSQELNEPINPSFNIKMEKVKVITKDSLTLIPHYQIIMEKVSLEKAKALYSEISKFPLSKNIHDDEEIWLGRAPFEGTYRNDRIEGKDPLVKLGDKVKYGQTLCYISSSTYPMGGAIEAGGDGTVIGICKREGESVKKEDLLFVFRNN